MHFDAWTIALQIVNFAILVWLLQRFLYRPVLRMIDARRAQVQQQYAAAQAAEDKAKAELAALASDRAGIAAEREAALKLAAAQAQVVADTRRTQAEHDAQALLDSARKTLAAEREHAFGEARSMALDLGTEFAQHLLAQLPMQLRAEAWIERIEQHLSALPQAQRGALTDQLADNATLTVVTAAALPPAMADTWSKRLHTLLGVRGAISFAVDPELIAGAELHFPTAVLHYSWQSALAEARAELDSNGNAH